MRPGAEHLSVDAIDETIDDRARKTVPRPRLGTIAKKRCVTQSFRAGEGYRLRGHSLTVVELRPGSVVVEVQRRRGRPQQIALQAGEHCEVGLSIATAQRIGDQGKRRALFVVQIPHDQQLEFFGEGKQQKTA